MLWLAWNRRTGEGRTWSDEQSAQLYVLISLWPDAWIGPVA